MRIYLKLTQKVYSTLVILTNKFYKETLSAIEKGASLNDLYRTLYKYEKLEDYDACAGIYKAIKKKINSLNN